MPKKVTTRGRRRTAEATTRPHASRPHAVRMSKAPDYGSWRSVAAGSLQGKKPFLDKDVPLQETIDGLLGILPVGARNVTYLSQEAMTAMQGQGEKADISKLPGVQTFSHGPYLDDWSKVPPEIAAKYNTAPK